MADSYAVLSIVAVVLLAGVPVGGAAGNGGDVPLVAPGGAAPTPEDVPPAPPVPDAAPAPSGAQDDGTAPPDPEGDVIGWEDGYWHNESIDVNQSDGLTDAEMEAYVSRAMARVEYLRGLEFEEDVEVSVITREEHRNRSMAEGNATGADRPTGYWRWNDQVWEGLLIVGEDTDVRDAFAGVTAGAVLGYYRPSTDELVIVSDSPGSPVVDNETLVHELVHALQDQHYNLSDPRYGGDTQDGQLAAGSLVEGDATLVTSQYTGQCGERWECVRTPPRAGSGGGGGVNTGILVALLSQYSDGMAFVHAVVERAGWEAVDLLYREPPGSMEQVIHVTTTEEPEPIAFENDAEGGWERFEGLGENGSDTVGEASIYAMLWYQSAMFGASAVNVSAFYEPDRGPFDYYDYTSEPSAGWANDRLFPYRNDGEYGYVWVTRWDTAEDAREFRRAYLTVLRQGQGASRVAPDTWVVEEGPFADAFHVERDGRTVTITNAPAREDLADIRPAIDAPAGNATGSG